MIRLLAALLVAAAALAASGGASVGSSASRASIEPAPRGATLGGLPASFDANEGQFDDAVRFVARGGGATAWLLDGEAVVAGPQGAPVQRMRFGGARPRGERRAAAKAGYFLGDDPSRWRGDVASFERVRCAGVAPGVDLVWRGTRRALEYDLVVAPGADPAAATIELVGETPAIDAASGDLLVGASRHSRPVAFQTIDGVRRDVEARFVLDGPRVRFAVGAHDPSRALVIDPTVSFATYYGGSLQDVPYAAALGPTGDVYVLGNTGSLNYPTVAPYQAQLRASGQIDLFVTRMKADGSGVVFSTYLGGTADELAGAIAVDAQGDAYVVGRTRSTNYPVLSALQATLAGGTFDAVATKLTGAGTTLVYSTYLGGSGDEIAFGCAVDAAGALHVGGATDSTNFPTASPRQAARAGGNDGFLTKLNAAGNGLLYSTYHGGSLDDFVRAVAVDAAGSAYVVGRTESVNFPLNAAFQAASGGGPDAFLSKYNAAGSALVYSTYLGGSGLDDAYALALDGAGVCIAGETGSSNFPLSSPAQPNRSGGQDAFVARYQPGSGLTFSTYLGGPGDDSAATVAVDPSGGIVVAGYATSSLPTLNAMQPVSGGGVRDGFLARFGGTPPSTTSSSYVGGAGAEFFVGAFIDASSNVVVVASTDSTNMTTKNPLQGASAGQYDTYVMKLAPILPAAPTNAAATLPTSTLIRLSWSDASTNETGFEIQRKFGSGSYSTYATVASGTTTYDDASLFGNVTYSYRVRALGAEGASAWSNEASATTPPGAGSASPPTAPDQTAAIAVSPTEIDLAWRDRSNDETRFEVQRADGGAAYAVVATPPQDAAGFADDAVLPGWPTSYRVRALGLQGPSAFSDAATTTTAGTLTLSTRGGALTDSTKAKKDKLVWKGGYASAGAALDPRAAGMRLQAGPATAPLVLTIPAGDPAWKAKKGKVFTWKSSKGAAPKFALTVDVAKRTVAATVTGFDFAGVVDGSVRLLFAVGAEGGGLAEAWPAARKPGVYTPPK